MTHQDYAEMVDRINRLQQALKPQVLAALDQIAALYKTVARRIAVKVADKAKDYSSKFPTITVSKGT